MLPRAEYSGRRVEQHKHAWIFAKKVDIKKLNIPDYYDIITEPMDFKTIKTYLKTEYKCVIRKKAVSREGRRLGYV
eukprot:4262920-Pyramimonas_sp.AAC.1